MPLYEHDRSSINQISGIWFVLVLTSGPRLSSASDRDRGTVSNVARSNVVDDPEIARRRATGDAKCVRIDLIEGHNRSPEFTFIGGARLVGSCTEGVRSCEGVEPTTRPINTGKWSLAACSQIDST
ncbi:ubiquitin-protein ligase [Aspergillus luchuensis]|uniref:Ubiquitin-protein ligase n=1 Tax=Aspergillus kawachii TaxID=1069201 RepID=A0A146FZ35_ASPKA|nr:ubiquitin-protein ligase [Aspergillus luchuensis]